MAAGGQLATEVSGAGCQIEDEIIGAEQEGIEGSPAPPNVEAKGHDAIDQVVAGRDGVEHGLHGGALGLPLGQWGIEARQGRRLGVGTG